MIVFNRQRANTFTYVLIENKKKTLTLNRKVGKGHEMKIHKRNREGQKHEEFLQNT